MLRWFHALMPKEERFFELFARHSHAVLAGAQALRAMMEGGEVCSALECCKQYCRGLDYHDPGVGRDRRDSIRAHKVLWLIRLQRARDKRLIKA
jgi:uncharacterized protein